MINMNYIDPLMQSGTKSFFCINGNVYRYTIYTKLKHKIGQFVTYRSLHIQMTGRERSGLDFLPNKDTST